MDSLEKDVKGKKPIKVIKDKQSLNFNFNISKKVVAMIFFIMIIFLLIIFISKFFKPGIEDVKNSVVLVEVYDENNELMATGSGFSAYEKNWIVTNFHVIEGANSISVITDNRQEYAVKDIIIFNKEEDLAILSIDGDLKTLKLGNGNNIKIKDKVTAIGSPMGEQNTVSEGIVSNTDEKNMIRITTPISHGSSGGVLLNDKNEVIGITSAGYDNAQNLNFAINVNVLKDLYSAYKNKEYGVIDYSNYKDCVPLIIAYNTKNELSINNKCSFSTSSNYTIDNLNLFYLVTNSYEIFNISINKFNIGGFLEKMQDNYKNLTKEEQKLVSEYYTFLLNYEDCNIDSQDECSIDNISNWNAEQLVMELDVMPTYALSIFLVEIDKYNYSTVFNYINSLPLDVPEKGVLLLLYGGYKPSDLNRNDANSVVNYINNYDLSISEKGKILEYLGYSVNGANVNW